MRSARGAIAAVRSQGQGAADMRRRDLAAIHAAAAAAGLDTADKDPSSTYRTVLFTQGREGKYSAADLSPEGRRRVLLYLIKLTKGPQSSGMGGKVEALWAALGKAGKLRDPSAEGLAEFITRRHGVQSVRWLTAIQAAQVIEAFKAWLARPMTTDDNSTSKR